MVRVRKHAFFCWRMRVICHTLYGMHNSHLKRRERASIVDWAANDNYTHAITLNTDRELSLARIKDICSTFCHQFDKQVHGQRNMRRFRIRF